MGKGISTPWSFPTSQPELFNLDNPSSKVLNLFPPISKELHLATSKWPESLQLLVSFPQPPNEN